MKKFMRLWAAMAVIGLIATGCVQDAPIDNGPVDGDGTTLVVSLQSLSPGNTRALIGDTTAEEILKYENLINDFTAYLFDETGAFLKKGATGVGERQIVFTGFEAGDQVQVVAFANVEAATGVTLPDAPANLNALLNPTLTQTLTLDSQLKGDGLFMSGRYGSSTTTGELTGDPIEVLEEGTNVITVPVERVVAKISLGEINIDFGSTMTISDIINFELLDVGVQKVVGTSWIYPHDFTTIPTTPGYYGTFAGLADVENPAKLYSTALPAYLDDNGSGLLDIAGLVKALLGIIKDGLDTIFPSGAIGIAGITPNSILGGLIDAVIVALDESLEAAIGLLDTILDVVDMPLGTIFELLDLDPLTLNLGEILYEPNNYWYVLPNPDNDTNPSTAQTDPTLLTLSGTDVDMPFYYPVAINDVLSAAQGKTGTGVMRNTKYIVNVTFTEFTGTNDPDDPHKGTNLIVKVVPVDWEGEIEQTTTW